MEKQYDQRRKGQWFFIEKKDGARIGYISHFRSKGCIGIGYVLVKGERDGQRNLLCRNPLKSDILER